MNYQQPREGRAIGGVIAIVVGVGILFFSTLIALESFSQHPAVSVLGILLGIVLTCAGLYFAACAPVMEFDEKLKQITVMKSCLLFRCFTRTEDFGAVKEVGIKEMYHAGSRGEETGTFYFVELRGRSILEVPGTRSRRLNDAIVTAKNISELVGASFNPTLRKVQTGSFKIR